MRAELSFLLVLAIVAIVLGAAAFYAFDWWTTSRFALSAEAKIVCHADKAGMGRAWPSQRLAHVRGGV
jgi:hypothetical protein